MFKTIEKFEDMIAKWLKPIPHLPKTFTKMVAENLWWIIIIGVVFSAIAAFSSVGMIITAASYVNRYSELLGIFANRYDMTSVLLSAIPAILFMAGTSAILGFAIAPLKAMKKNGWSLLFITMLIQAVYVIINAFSAGVIGFFPVLIFGAAGVAITAYLLNEMRVYFDKSFKVVEPSKASEATVKTEEK